MSAATAAPTAERGTSARIVRFPVHLDGAGQVRRAEAEISALIATGWQIATTTQSDRTCVVILTAPTLTSLTGP